VLIGTYKSGPILQAVFLSYIILRSVSSFQFSVAAIRLAVNLDWVYISLDPSKNRWAIAHHHWEGSNGFIADGGYLHSVVGAL